MTLPPSTSSAGFPRTTVIAILGSLTFCLTATAQTAPRAEPHGEVVQLEKFTVTTEIGNYAEASAITASKSEIPLRDLPRTVSILNAAFISDLRATNMSDLYQYITGLSYNDFRNNDGFSIRGMQGSTNVKNLQVDGLPGTAARFNTPSTSNIDRVEVLKGPAAVLYGYMEPGGLVNMVTKKPMSQRRVEVFTSLGTYASDISRFGADKFFTGRVDLTGPLDAGKHWLYRMIVDYENLERFRRGVVHKNLHIYPSLSYVWNTDTSLTLSFEYLRERRGADEGLVIPLNRIDLIAAFNVRYQRDDDIEEDNGKVFSGLFKHTFSNDWKLTLAGRAVRHGDYGNFWRNSSIVNNANAALTAVQLRPREQDNIRNYDYLDAVLDGDIQAGNLTHRVIFGVTVGAEQNIFNSISNTASHPNNVAWRVNVYNPVFSTPLPAAIPGNYGDTKIDSSGFYTQALVSVTPKIKAMLSARHDRMKQDFMDRRSLATGKAEASATVPTFGVVYQPSDTTSFYASYSEGFHPVLNAFSAEDINGVSGEWSPEESRQKEVGFKLDFPTNSVSLTGALFEIEKDNLIELTNLVNPKGNFYWVPVGSMKSSGAELEFQYRPKPHIQIRGGYAYVDAQITNSRIAASVNAPLRNVPKHSVNLWARYNFAQGPLEGFGVGVGGIYQSDRFGVTTNVATAQYILPSYVKLDGALYYNWKKYSFAVNFSNLLDERYLPGSGSGTTAGDVRVTVGPPRQIIASVRRTF